MKHIQFKEYAMPDKKSCKEEIIVRSSAEREVWQRARDTEKDQETEPPRLPGPLDVINEGEQVVPQMADLQNPPIYFCATDGPCQYA